MGRLGCDSFATSLVFFCFCFEDISTPQLPAFCIRGECGDNRLGYFERGIWMDKETVELLRKMESHMDSIRRKVTFLFWVLLVGVTFVVGGFAISAITTFLHFWFASGS